MGEIKTRADAHGVTSIPIPGYWIHKTEDLKPNIPPYAGEKVLFHLHGGAFSVETAHPSGGMSAIPRGYLQHTPFLRRTFAVEYRLSTSSPRTNKSFPSCTPRYPGWIHSSSQLGIRGKGYHNLRRLRRITAGDWVNEVSDR